MLTKDEITAAANAEVREIEIAALGGSVRIREMTAKEWSDHWKWHRKYVFDHNGENPTDYDALCRLGPLLIVDDSDQPIWAAKEFGEIFARKRQEVISQLTAELLRLSVPDESAEKNSGETGTGSLRIA